MPIAHHIRLEPESHKYFDAEGNQYTSVSSVLSRYKEPFDRAAIAKKVAQRDGRTIEDVYAEWDSAAPYGTAVHEQLEHYFLRKDFATDMITPYLADLDKWRSQPAEFYPETILYLPDFMIAGTADMLVCWPDGDRWSILDWKTNGKIHKTAYKSKRLKPPLDHLEDCNYVHYSLQLNLYARMLGRKTNKLTIVHLPRGETRLEIIPCLELQKEVDLILDDLANAMLPF